MSDSNNVISFKSRKTLKDAEPALREVSNFMHTYDDLLEGVQFMVDNLVDDMAEFYGFDPDTEMLGQDYILLVESAMSLLMRTRGIDHPICAEFADNTFNTP